MLELIRETASPAGRNNSGQSTEKETCSEATQPILTPFPSAGAVTPAVGLAASQINWCRDNIPGFRAMNDQAEKAKRETEDNRRRMAR